MTGDEESVGDMIDRIQSVDRSQRKPIRPVEYYEIEDVIKLPQPGEKT